MSDEPVPQPPRLKMKKLHQIARLVHMLQRWRRASAAALSSPRLRRPSSSVHLPPAGYLAVYVGEERRRFEVRAEKLNHPLFRGVLAKTQEEFGWEQPGALAIACDVASFERLLRMTDLMQDAEEEESHARKLHCGGSGHGDARLLELLRCHVRHPQVVKEDAACGIMQGLKNGECV